MIAGGQLTAALSRCSPGSLAAIAMRTGIESCLLTIVPAVPGPAFAKGGPPHVIGLLDVGISCFLAPKADRSPCKPVIRVAKLLAYGRGRTARILNDARMLWQFEPPFRQSGTHREWQELFSASLSPLVGHPVETISPRFGGLHPIK
jgi:hypothetical protein